jgi:hypothetical protein
LTLVDLQLDAQNSYLFTYNRVINPLHVELNPICHLLALLENHHIFHVSWLRVNLVLLENNGLMIAVEGTMDVD